MQNSSRLRQKAQWRISKRRSQRRQEQLMLSYLNVEPSRPMSPPSLANHIVPRFLSRLKHEALPQLPPTLIALTTLNKTCTSKPARKFSSKKVLISEDEKARMSTAFPKQLQKLEILGKGAVSVIWLAQDTTLQKKVAAKQFLKDCRESYERERRFVRVLDTFDCEHFIRHYYNCRVGNTDFMVYQLAERSLGKALYEMKGDFYNSQRVYRIHLTDFYWDFVRPANLRRFIREMAGAIQQLMKNNFSHNDLKPQNLLIGQDGKLKVCDYGSMSLLGHSEARNMITPEYMPPEVLLGFDSELIDVWSLGIIVVELLHGIPIWMCYKCWLERDGNNILATGLLAVKGKHYDKIVLKQRWLVRHIQSAIAFATKTYPRTELHSLVDLLEQILSVDPEKRARPQDILNHQFLAEN